MSTRQTQLGITRKVIWNTMALSMRYDARSQGSYSTVAALGLLAVLAGTVNRHGRISVSLRFDSQGIEASCHAFGPCEPCAKFAVWGDQSVSFLRGLSNSPKVLTNTLALMP